MKRIVRSALVVLGLGCIAALPARALDIPPAITSTTCDFTGGVQQDPLACQNSFDSAKVTFGDVASVQAAASYPGAFAHVNPGADAVMTYSWAFFGGNPGDLLHVEIDVHLAVSSFGSINARAFASLISQTAPTPFAQACVETTGSCGDANRTVFDGALHVLARAGDINTLQLQAEANGAFAADANGSTALADPHIFLDPAFPTTGYTLLLSAGVGNALPVPEPGAWLLMAAGLAALSLRGRRAGAAPAGRRMRR